MKRLCANRRGCSEYARSGGRYCRGCATLAQRQHRASGREKPRQFQEEEVLVRRARAYVATYVKRGKLERPAGCERCGSLDVSGYWEDPRRPLHVRWLCTECRADRRETKRELDTQKHAIRIEFEEMKKLLPEILARLHAEAQTGLGGPPGTLRYTIAIKLAYRKWLQSQNPFWT